MEKQISIFEDKKAENTQSEQQKQKRIQKNEDSIRSLWDNLKQTDIHIVGLPEGTEREQGNENLFEKIMTENFPNLVKEIDIQVQESPKQDEPKKAHTKTHHK